MRMEPSLLVELPAALLVPLDAMAVAATPPSATNALRTSSWRTTCVVLARMASTLWTTTP